MQELYLGKKLPSTAFSEFSLRLASQKISEAAFKSMIETLLSRVDDSSAQSVVVLVYGYYFNNNKAKILPQDLVYRVLTCKVNENQQHHAMYSYYFYQIGEEYIAQYPGHALKLLEELLNNFSSWRLNRGRHNIGELTEKIVKEKPEESWRIISRYLENDDTRCFQIIHWLGGPFKGREGNDPICHIPAESIIEWIKIDPENRIWKISHALPKTLETESGLTNIFIEEFADDHDVANGIISHFHTGSWTGPDSVYLEEKRNQALRWISKTDSLQVRLWLDRYIGSLTERIDSARIREEREF